MTQTFATRSPAAPDPATRRARLAVAALFFTNGTLFANVVPRYPRLKAELGLDNAALGSAVAAFPLGALLAGLLAPALIKRFRSANVAVGGTILLGATLLALSVIDAWIAFAAVLLVAGGLDAVIDVAQNTHGLRVQRAYGRSINNSFHGVWSIGAVVGGSMGAAAAGLDVPLVAHLGASAALATVVVLVARRYTLPGPDDSERTVVVELQPTGDGSAAVRRLSSARRTALRLLAVLGVLAACGALVEDAGASWGAVYLSSELGAGAATAGLAFVALQSAMTIGRLGGDRVVDRFGQRTTVRAGGLVAAVGMGIALAAPTTATTLLGFALAGLGTATLIPAAMHTADEIPGLPNGMGLAAVSWLLRVGFLLSPVLVGLVADAASLRVGLLSVVLAGTTAAMLGRVLANRADQHTAG